MSRSEHHIDKLSPELIDKYLKGKLSEQEAYEVELLMLRSDFDKEAMEGFEESESDIRAELTLINKQLENRISSEKKDVPFLWIKVAASLLILALSTYLIWDISKNPKLEDLAVTQQEPAKEANDSVGIDTIEKELNAIDTSLIAEENSEEEKARIPIEIYSSNEQEEIVEGDEQEKVIGTDLMPVSKEHDINQVLIAEELITEGVEIVDDESESDAEITPQNSLQGKVAGVEIAEQPSSTTARSAKKQAKTSLKRDELQALTGEVISAEDGSPLAGVNVVVKGTTIGTVTDTNGKFSIDSMPAASKELLISFIGLRTQEVAFDSQSFLSIPLEADEQQLSEIVITAEGVEREKRALGYAVDRYEESNNKALPTVTVKEYEQYLTDSIRYNNRSTDRGQVRLKFDVNIDGTLSNFEIDKSLGEWQDQEAIRLIKEGPSWKPATKNGNPQKERVKVTIKFKSK